MATTTEAFVLDTDEKILVVLAEEPGGFCFDPNLVQSIHGIAEDARSRHGEKTRMTFKDGGWVLLYTEFWDVIEQFTNTLEKVNRG